MTQNLYVELEAGQINALVVLIDQRDSGILEVRPLFSAGKKRGYLCAVQVKSMESMSETVSELLGFDSDDDDDD